MPQSTITEQDLVQELRVIRERYTRLEDDELFVLWFVRAFLTEDDEHAEKALCGGKDDKGIDAVMVDADTKNVFIIQGKYREQVDRKSEKRNDILNFADLASILSGEAEQFAHFCEGLLESVKERLVRARRQILSEHYNLQLFYVTLGRCSESLTREAEHHLRPANCSASIDIFTGRRVLLLLKDYLDGVAPPVPSLDLEMEGGDGIEVMSIFHRRDTKVDIESWVFSMTSQGLAELFEHSRDRLFARNIRGFLGSTEINRGMEATLKKEPEFFWYYNNGVTIICDDADEVSSHGKHILHVRNPQVINGQQTTRTLSKFALQAPKASVTVRVIRVSRDAKYDANRFDTLVSHIVQATNWQNAILPSDLISNDQQQIRIERELRKLNYWYIRKRQSKSEARKLAGSYRYHMLTKERLAQAVAACDLDPAIVREGKEGLFEERLYGTVFPTSDPYYYLTRYWLMNTVGAAAHGYPERAYAKWLVLHFVWKQICPSLRTRARAQRFGEGWEQNGKVLDYLWTMNNGAFSAALAFYRLKRGKGAKAIDVSTFFKRRSLDHEFEKFWHGSHNTHRAKFRKALHRLEQLLSEES